jgi:hypothetical protein
MDGEAGFLREQGREAQKAVPSNARTGVSCESSERPAMDGRAGLRAEQGLRSEKCGLGLGETTTSRQGWHIWRGLVGEPEK